jgi:hypothetical protein
VRNRLVTLTTVTAALVVAAITLPAAAAAEPVALLAGGAANPTLSLLDTEHAGQVTNLPITGIGAGELVQSIDVRPKTGVLYAVTTENTGVNYTGRLYALNLATGAATLIGTSFSPSIAVNATVGIDFDPATDRLRVISDFGDNLLVDPTDATLVAGSLPLASTDVDAPAYDRNVAGTTVTTAYAIDFTNDRLVTLGGANGAPPADGGTVAVVGPLGIDVAADSGMDISTASNVAFLVGGGAAQQLYTVNLTSGAATLVPAHLLSGPTDIAVLAPSTIGLAGATATGEERNHKLDVTITRVGSTQVAGSVDFATADGTAKAGSDYTAVSGTVKFAVGETTKTISIPLTDDGSGDAKETFTLTLSNATGASLGTAVQTITLVETQVADKTPPAIVLSDLGIKAYRFYSVNGMHTTFSCQEACKVVYTVRLGSVYIAKRTGALTRAGVGIANAPNTMLGKSRLIKAMASSRNGKLVARFAIQATDANGLKRTLVRNFQIVR